LAVLVALGIAALSLYVAPRTAALGYEVRARAETTSDLSAVSAGRFQESSSGNMVFYAERVSPDHEYLERVFVRSEQNGVPNLLTAQRAHTARDARTGDRFLVMEDGYRYQGHPGDESYRVLKFNRHGVRLESVEVLNPRMKNNALPTEQLWGSAEPRNVAELQWRLSLPLAAVSLVLLAVPLSRTTPRHGRFGRLFGAVLIFIVYYNLLGTSQVWVEKGVLGALPGLWWVHALPVVATLVLFYAARMPAPRRHKIRGSA